MAKTLGGTPSQTSPDALAKADRQAEALRLRKLGMSTPEIAARLGVNRKTAWAYVSEAVTATRVEIAEHGAELRAIEVEKIAGYLAHLRGGLEAGDPAAHRAALGWHQRLAKLQGLDLQVDAPSGPQVIVVDARRPWERGEVIDGDAAGLVSEAAAVEAGDVDDTGDAIPTEGDPAD